MKQLIKQIVESKFNFNIDVESNERQNSLSKSFFNSKSQKQAYEDQYLVDLGLPSKTLWSKYNLGCDYELLNNNHEQAKLEDWYGNYYAWGETTSKQDYSWETYAYGSLTKYCPVNRSDCWSGSGDPDGLTELLPEDDAARQNFGSGWHMPSSELLLELYTYTNNEWTNDYNGTGVAGQIFRGNNQKLFIPAAGLNDGGSDLSGCGSNAYVWSLNLDLDNPYYAYYLYFYSGGIRINYDVRCCGMSIRPVLFG